MFGPFCSKNGPLAHLVLWGTFCGGGKLRKTYHKTPPQNSTNCRPHPPPKNGAYGLKGGVRMPYFLQEFLDFHRLSAILTPIVCMAYFWAIFFSNMGGGQNYFQKRFWNPPPPTYDAFCLFVHPLSFSWRKRVQTRRIPLSEASKLVLEASIYTTFPPPKSHDTFCPPLCDFPIGLSRRIDT